MSEIEKMKRYIERTKLNISAASPYQMSTRELFATSTLTVFDAVNLAFKYGQAKGYRAAKAEGRTGTRSALYRPLSSLARASVLWPWRIRMAPSPFTQIRFFRRRNRQKRRRSWPGERRCSHEDPV